MSISDEGFIQDYELNVHQELWLYCRLCRNTFQVIFKPKTDQVKLKCVCGQENPLTKMDVFDDEGTCKDHAAFYERIYRAAKGALKDQGFPVPPSGKWAKVTDIEGDPEFQSYFDPERDASAIQDGYIEPDDSDISPAGIGACLADFDRQLAEVGDDPVGRHEVLSELVNWSYCRRHLSDEAAERFQRACQEDIDIAREVIAAAKQRMGRGEKVRLSFASFKSLLVDLEERGELERALVVAERAANLGLAAYVERVTALRMKLGLE